MSFRRLTLAIALLLAPLALRADSSSPAPAIPDGWFLSPAVEPAAGSALDISALNVTPGADGLPRISVRDGHFVTPAGQRIRFWGCNLAAVEAFPNSAAEADSIARRLAKGGVNIARLHHLDNPWGVGHGASLWPADRPEHRELDPAQLDKLHRLIAALRDRGIYSNLNLKVSKALVAADGFDPSVSEIPHFQKRVDIFDRRMIDLQKDYARRLLTTRNPYTGLAPAADPAVAIVEINNENSLLGFWTRDLGRGLEKLPAPFREELRGQWNVWLSRHYADDDALARAWAPAAGAAGDSLIPADANWVLRQQPGSAATLAPDTAATAPVIRVTAASGIDWHVQLSLGGIALDDGAVYTVEFLAKADHARKLGVGIGIDSTARPHEAWRSFGLLETVNIADDWQPVRLVFPAHSVAGAPAALSFNTAQSTGSVAIKNLRLIRDGVGAGLQPGQSVRHATVPLPTAPSAAQWRDWIHFLADTERAFAEEMRAYLKDELHVQALVICSQIDYGGLTGLNRERTMDFADGHAYWQHPDFPGDAGWDSARWTIRNTPQLAEFGDRAFAELGNLAWVRVAGKPFTVSEYDHPAPSEFACEMYPEIASFAARQDWDIVYPFCIGGAYDRLNPAGRITDYFDQLHHPAKWGLSPFAALLFRQGFVAPAPATAELHLGSPVWTEQPHADVLWRQLLPPGPIDFLNVRYAVSDRPGPAGVRATLTSTTAPVPAGEPVRLVSAPQGRVYVVASDAAAAVVGYLGGASVEAGALRVTSGRFGRDFATVAAVALDRRSLRTSSRVLVTIVARAGNQGTVWNEARTSLGKNWGDGPTIAERVPATVTLDGDTSRHVYALAPDGSRARTVTATARDGALTFTVQPDDRTIHYEIAAE